MLYPARISLFGLKSFMRLDSYLYVNGEVTSRNKAQHLIKLGRIKVNGAIETKPSREVKESDKIEVIKELDFASMGGFKLEKAIEDFNLDITGNIAVDIGASNGGFTSCMLRRNVLRVYAVDVGECAFDKELLSDSRVIVRDKLNARDITVDDIGERADFISIDVSFISLTLILNSVLALLSESGKCVALIKPQFEAGRSALSKKGMVLNKKEHLRIVYKIIDHIESLGYKATNFTVAPIRENRNIEYLVLIERCGFSISRKKVEETIRGEK